MKSLCNIVHIEHQSNEYRFRDGTTILILNLEEVVLLPKTMDYQVVITIHGDKNDKIV